MCCSEGVRLHLDVDHSVGNRSFAVLLYCMGRGRGRGRGGQVLALTTLLRVFLKLEFDIHIPFDLILGPVGWTIVS